MDTGADRTSEVCPRCGAVMPGHPGALSRYDNKTEVCSECGVVEAIWQWAYGPHSLPPPDRPLLSEGWEQEVNDG